MAKIKYYYNNKDCPIAFSFNRNRITLWSKGDRLVDREGNPITDPDLDNVAMRNLGLVPCYETVSPKSAPQGEPKKNQKMSGEDPVVTTEAINDQPAFSPPEEKDEQQEEDQTHKSNAGWTPDNSVEGDDDEDVVVTSDEEVDIQDNSEKEKVVAVRPKEEITEEELRDPDLLVCFKDKDDWVFKLDNYSNPNPAGMKMHIRQLFGGDVLERVEFRD